MTGRVSFRLSAALVLLENGMLRRLRRQPETAGTTLVAITGYGQEQDRREALRAGFNFYFAKPVDTGKLTNLLNEIGKS